MSNDFRSRSIQMVATLKEHLPLGSAVKLAIGGEFDAIGILERQVLIQYGLLPDHYLIDVGCGAGRLAIALSEYLTGPYLGIDVVPDLLEHAGVIAADRPNWRIEMAPGLKIPEQDAQADFICFFSVFTHLLHEQS